MKTKKAFGLFELIVVLLVASVLYVVVMKGSDAITGAKTVKVTKTFMDEWINLLNNYKDRTGHHIYGSKTNPNINSTETNSSLSAPRLCREFEVVKEFSNAGLNLNQNLVTNGTACINYVEGKFVGEPMTVAFGAMRIGGDQRAGIRNVLIFQNVKVGIAKRFDRYIDGESDGTRGSVISDGRASTHRIDMKNISGNDPSLKWDPKPWSMDDNLLTTVYIVYEDR